MKFIIHDWSDDDSIAILKNIRAAMNFFASGKLTLIEIVIPEGHDPAFAAKFMDLNMLVMTGGQERTATEYATLFLLQPLKLARVLPTHSVCSIIEASRRHKK